MQLLRLVLYIAAAFGGGFIFIRFLLPWAAPFILAFALAAMMEPLVRALQRCRWKRGAAAAVVTLSFLGVIVFLVVKLVAYLASFTSQSLEKIPIIMEKLGENIESLMGRLSNIMAASPPGIAEILNQNMESAAELLYTLPSLLTQWLPDFLAKAAQRGPDVLLFAVTAGIGTYFISASFPRTTAFIIAQIPPGIKQRFSGFGRDLKGSFGGFIRSQLILMAMTFVQLLIAFWVLGIKNCLLPALITAFVDALPVFGTGIILVPWALYGLLLGNSLQGFGLLVSWLVVSLVRNCAQAKLLGDQIGLEPLASLLAIYVGWQVWNIWGMLLFPLVLVTLQQLNDKGLIKLWNRI